MFNITSIHFSFCLSQSLILHRLIPKKVGLGETGGRRLFKKWNSVAGNGYSNNYFRECGEGTLKLSFKTDVFYLNYILKNALSGRDAGFERKLF